MLTTCGIVPVVSPALLSVACLVVGLPEASADTQSVLPQVVFDGGSLPAKEQTRQERSASRCTCCERCRSPCCSLHAPYC